jgi:hypothetical protein
MKIKARHIIFKPSSTSDPLKPGSRFTLAFYLNCIEGIKQKHRNCSEGKLYFSCIEGIKHRNSSLI